MNQFVSRIKLLNWAES